MVPNKISMEIIIVYDLYFIICINKNILPRMSSIAIVVVVNQALILFILILKVSVNYNFKL